MILLGILSYCQAKSGEINDYWQSPMLSKFHKKNLPCSQLFHMPYFQKFAKCSLEILLQKAIVLHMYILKKKIMVNIVDNMPRKMSKFNSARVKLAAQGKK